MNTTDTLRRMYLFSDTYGRSKSPFDQDDADAHITTDFRSFPILARRREFDIYGRESVTGHVMRMMVNIHKHVRNAEYNSQEVKDEFENTITGIFINAAPRTNTSENGAPFYVAVLDKNIRVVTTDLKALSSVREHVESLHVLPNDNNGLYDGKREQFRSSYTPRLLFPDHGFKLEEQSLEMIPEFPADRWELSYVDRFGNMLTYSPTPDKVWDEVLEHSKELDGEVKVILGNVSQRAKICESLKEAEPGALVMYLNDGNIEVLRKWEEDEDRYTRLYQSAYFRFAKPDIGAKMRVRS